MASRNAARGQQPSKIAEHFQTSLVDDAPGLADGLDEEIAPLLPDARFINGQFHAAQNND